MRPMDNETIKSVMAELGSRGGKTAAARLTPEQRIERARKGGKTKAANASRVKTSIPK